MDTQEITDHYEDVSPELAERFVNELGKILNVLCLQPDLWPRRYAHYLSDRSLRFWLFDSFPFMLFYRSVGGQVDVVRVLHERRNIQAEIFTDF